MYRPKWSAEILLELKRTLEGPRYNLKPEKTAYRIACMESAFPEALISGYEFLTRSMPNDYKDRHVLAAAVHGKVDAIITENRRHFPMEWLAKFGIERLSTDQFLVHQWHLDPNLVYRRVMEQAASEKRDLDSHLTFLQKMVPAFVSLMRSQ